ncbi:hypothetical protein TPAR_01724, partial [Tolypocladium paradoxum]
DVSRQRVGEPRRGARCLGRGGRGGAGAGEEDLLHGEAQVLRPEHPQEPHDPDGPRQHGHLHRHALPRGQHGPRDEGRVRGPAAQGRAGGHDRRRRRRAGRQPARRVRHGVLPGGLEQEGRRQEWRRGRRRGRREEPGCQEM